MISSAPYVADSFLNRTTPIDPDKPVPKPTSMTSSFWLAVADTAAAGDGVLEPAHADTARTDSSANIREDARIATGILVLMCGRSVLGGRFLENGVPVGDAVLSRVRDVYVAVV